MSFVCIFIHFLFSFCYIVVRKLFSFTITIKIAKLLHETNKKNKEWKCNEEQQRAFNKLKRRFIKEPILMTPSLDKKVRIEIDPLNFAISRVL